MRNLFSAHLFRLVRARIFYFGMAALFVMELYLLYSNHGDIVSGTASVDNTFFFFTMMGVIAVSAFCGLFVGAEYSSGSLRNKLITGHTKTAVYLSCLLVSGLAADALSQSRRGRADLLPGMANLVCHGRRKACRVSGRFARCGHCHGIPVHAPVTVHLEPVHRCCRRAFDRDGSPVFRQTPSARRWISRNRFRRSPPFLMRVRPVFLRISR